MDKGNDAGYCSDESKDMFLDIVTLTDFVKSTQPMAWKRFERMCTINPIRQFYKAFENARHAGWSDFCPASRL